MMMPSPEWVNASTDEKLEMLRKDVAILLSRQSPMGGASLLKEVVAAAVKEELEKRLPKAAEKKK